MADSGGEILKEFLVGLGFKLDASAQAKMQGAIGEVTRSVVKLGEVFTATSVAIEAAVVAIASKMEEIYFAAQRAGASANNLMALRYAAQQVGIGADAITSAITGMRMAMLSNPGTEQMLNMLGVQTRVQGQMMETGKVFENLMTKLSKMPDYLAFQYGQLLGISADAILMWRQNGAEIMKFQREYDAELARAGLNQNIATTASHDLMTSIRSLGMSFDVLATTIELRFGPSIKWFVAQGKELAHWLEDLDKKTNGWSTTLGTTLVASLLALSVAWKLFNLSILATPIGAAVAAVVALGVAITALVVDFRDWQRTGQSIVPWAKWAPEIDAALKGITQFWSQIKIAVVGPLNDLRDAIANLWKSVAFTPSGAGEGIGRYLSSLNFGTIKQNVDSVTAAIKFVTDAIKTLTDVLGLKWDKAWKDAAAAATDAMKAIGFDPDHWLGFGADSATSWWDGWVKNWKKELYDFLGIPEFTLLGKKIASLLGIGTADAGPAPHALSGGPHQTGERDPGVLRSIWNSITGGDTNPKMPEGRTKDAMAFFEHMGWTADQAAGIVANLVQESGLNPEAVGDNGTSFGLAQMHNERAADMIDWIKAQGLNPKDFRAQLEYIQHDLTEGAYKSVGDALHKIHNAQQSGQLISHDYEQPADTQNEMARRGLLATKIISNQPVAPSWMHAPPKVPANATLNQKTEIHVSGTGDALTTARHVADAQNRVNGDLARNFAGALDVAPAGAS